MIDDSRTTSGTRSPVPLGRALSRGVPLAVLTALLCAVAAYLLSARQEETYEASSLVLVRALGGDPALGSEGSGLDEGEGTATDALLVPSRGVLAATARRAGVDQTAEELEDAVSAEAISGTNVVRVTATAPSAEGAAAAATGVAQTYVSARRAETRRRARAARTALTGQYDQLGATTQQGEAGLRLLERIQELRTVERLGQQAPRVVESAAVPDAAVSPRPARDAALGALFGLLLGGGLGVLWAAAGRPRAAEPGSLSARRARTPSPG